MKKITLKELRPLLQDVVGDFQKTDEELLNTDLVHEYSFDSIDFEDLTAAVQYHCGIEITPGILEKSAFFNEPTVSHFLDMCNKRA